MWFCWGHRKAIVRFLTLWASCPWSLHLEANPLISTPWAYRRYPAVALQLQKIHEFHLTSERNAYIAVQFTCTCLENSLEMISKPSQKSRTFTSEIIAQFLQFTRSTSWSPNSWLKASGLHRWDFRRLCIPDTNTGWEQRRRRSLSDINQSCSISSITSLKAMWFVVPIFIFSGNMFPFRVHVDLLSYSLLVTLTCPCFQHSLKIFQLLLLLGSCRQRSRPSQSQEWEVGPDLCRIELSENCTTLQAQRKYWHIIQTAAIVLWESWPAGFGTIYLNRKDFQSSHCAFFLIAQTILWIWRVTQQQTSRSSSFSAESRSGAKVSCRWSPEAKTWSLWLFMHEKCR